MKQTNSDTLRPFFIHLIIATLVLIGIVYATGETLRFRWGEKEAMGSWGKITTLGGIPPDKDVIKFVRVAAQLNEKGVKSPKRQPKPVVVDMPADFMKAIKANKKALATYENFSPSNKRDYTDWINSAKSEETRNERMKTAVGWMSEGKPRMWKYMKK